MLLDRIFVCEPRMKPQGFVRLEWQALDRITIKSADSSRLGVLGFTGSLAPLAAELLPAAADSLQLPLLPNSQILICSDNIIVLLAWTCPLNGQG